MGRLTRDEIVSEGQLLAGRDDDAAASVRWLQRWLDSVAASWPWPVLQDEMVDVAVGAGVTSIDVGNTTTETIQKVQDNIWVYDSAKTFRKRCRIRHQLSSPVDRVGPSTNIGVPINIRVFAKSFGVWTLRFEPTPDQSYLMTIPYLRLPAKLTSGTDVPWYPNDETMVQAVAFKNHEFYDGKDAPVTQAAQATLAGLVTNDRIRYGVITGVNDKLGMDPAVFKRSLE